MLNIETLKNGTPEHQKMLREMAERVRKAERKRAAVAAIALEDYDTSTKTTDAAAEFCREMNGAHNDYSRAMADATHDLMIALSGGEDLMDKLGAALHENRIRGLTMDSDGNVCGLGEDGPTEIPDEVRSLVARLANVPGMLPPPLVDAVKSMFGDDEDVLERALFEGLDVDTTPVGEDSIDGIDLNLTIDEPVFRSDSIRDFDGGLGS